MSTTATAPRQRRIFSHELYELLFGTVYVGLMTNLLLVIAVLPAVALLLFSDIAGTWPLLVLASPLLAPALTATFAVFADFSDHGSTTAVRTFARAWWRDLRRSLTLGAAVAAVVSIAAVNIRFLMSTSGGAGAMLIPIQAMLALIALATGLMALVGVPELRDLRLRDLLRAALYLAMRRWYLTVGAFVVLGLLGSLVIARPAIALGVAAAPLLFVVWGTLRFALRPLLPDQTS
ncbi:ferredoxin-NADPH reductase [Cellulomonas sp. NPDC089187]|uniref:ferredoxin-NADPH reductase n=1 Tax=Cellulomonas sp. NPDC089187 TaxID=3154970 RepID=UPI0034204E37